MSKRRDRRAKRHRHDPPNPRPVAPRLTARGHQHGEAYCVMTYASDDGAVVERIWNSRDGVTPFTLTARDGETSLTHVRWNEDTYDPAYVPQPGERIFVDLTPERARLSAERNAERYGETYPPTREQYANPAALAKVLAKTYLEQPGSPDLIEITVPQYEGIIRSGGQP